jgi:oxygen-independent coproporphyrinogen-3 oxidase
MDTLSLYIHIPFCQTKCSYCDFNSYADLDSLHQDYAAALIREMALAGRVRVQTIYMGGGTPTVLPLTCLAKILEAAFAFFAVKAGVEVSIEANPGTVDTELLSQLRTLGVTRLSLGVQSFDDRELGMLGRIHTVTEARQAIRAAREAGFDNLNLDLIYGLPTQSLDTWQSTLEEALALRPEHLSLYSLTLEQDTPLERSIAQGTVPMPDTDLAAEMYECAQDVLATAGYDHYEISNWSRSHRFRCQHNLAYWWNQPYLGVGAGAHSWAGGRRWANVAAPAEYVNLVREGRCFVDAEETIDEALEMGETMMMGLRLVEEGVELGRFRARFGIDVLERFAEELAELQELGLIAVNGERVKLTSRGRLLGNQAFLRFLPD